MKHFVKTATLAAIAWQLAGCAGETPASPPDDSAEPRVTITRPDPVQGIAYYSRVISFEWKPAADGRVDFTRYLWSQVNDTDGNYDPGFDFTKDLNENPWRYEQLWSEWTVADTASGAGMSAVIGDDETLQVGRYHFFAVQARSSAGRVTTSFDKAGNVRHFLVRSVSGPYLRIFEPVLGGFRFIDTGMSPVKRSIPPGIPLRFRWKGDVSSYSGDIAGYRHGWDLSDPDRWDAPFTADGTSSTEAVFHAGTHTLTIETSNLAGDISRGTISIEIIPWTMELPLLLVDDFYSVNAPIPDLSFPPEYEHDAFWESICSTVPGFDPARDTWDCRSNLSPPGMSLVGRYKNMIWTYSGGGEWDKMLLFVPESLMDETPLRPANLIPVFLKKGGHVWTLGRSDAGRGLAAVLPQAARVFPCDLRCEIAGAGGDCSGGFSGAESYAYGDLCVTVIDKISGIFRSDPDMPYRLLAHYDVMLMAVRDRLDPVTARYPGIPPLLELRDDVTAEGSFFCTDTSCALGGFTYVEVYDPEYWMIRKSILSRECFHPLYRMVTASDESAVYWAPVAFWITSYEDVVPEVSSGEAAAAPSVHLGFPLWFFRKSSADSLAAAIFEAWRIGPVTGGAR